MTFSFLRMLAVAGAGLVITGATFAQTASPPAHVPLQKKIGAPTSKHEVVPSLFVLNSRSATLQNGKLVLSGVSPNVVVFADRPARSAGHDLTSRIVEDWASGSDNFVKDPPNATVSTFQKDGSGVLDAVVVLKSARQRPFSFAALPMTANSIGKSENFLRREDSTASAIIQWTACSSA